MGSWDTAFGQVTCSVPENPYSPKSTSIIPAPSVPGSQAVTKAAAWFSWVLMISGRPD